MEFYDLDLQTPNSTRLRDFYAMRYNTIDHMDNYVSKVTMEGDFDNSYVDSDDIGFFAPELKNWKMKIRLNGKIKGPVENLSGNNIVVVAGKNTLLNGDFQLKGLPNIQKTFIEFRANDLRTSYSDVATFVPQLRKIKTPHLEKINRFRFVGTFTGYVKDFVTNGTIETNIGNLVADVNMTLHDNKPSNYYGDVSTKNFDLGQFLGIDNMGKIAFTGKLSGSGLSASNVNTTLDGLVSSFDYHNYTYQNISVNGTIAKEKFNGKLISKDPNLDAQMIGLIDYSLDQPKFAFNAEVGRTSLRTLHLIDDSVEFGGKLKVDFTGNNIDNFIGTAKVYDAAIFKNGQQISFDSLVIDSRVVDNSKTLTIISNEFDGALAGEFSIHDLPNAVQTFLNRYYPAYIKPAKTLMDNQNFSFVVTSRRVDDYISFVDKNLHGFNNSTFSGRINTKTNQLDLNVEVPQFGYKNFSFDNVTLLGIGTLDSLSISSDIGDVFVNDSLHFPNTHLRLSASNDFSKVHITTSASKTLNSANIDAVVRTSQNGADIKFNPSSFDVNGKNWYIQKNGEFSIDQNIITANDLRIYSDDQQILVTTQPSSAGNWNDVHFDLKKINIGDFVPFLVKSDRFEGLLTGSGYITNPLSKTSFFNFDGKASQFRLNNDSVGVLDLHSDYDKSTGLVNAAANSDNKNYHFDFKGIFNILDSAASKPIDISTNFHDTKIDLLEKYIGTIFSNVKGFATGNLKIFGTGNQLKYVGDIKLKDGQLKVNYTQCTYKIPSATVAMRDGYIDFGSFQIKDSLGNTGTVSRGKLMHHSFDDLAYDFSINTNKLLVLNTHASDNNQFFGKLIARANMTLTGPNDNMVMEIKGAPADSSNIYLPMNTTHEDAEADFLVWKVYGKEMHQQSKDKSANLTVKLDINANDYANVFVIVDPLTGDIMKATGHGNLQLKVGTTEDLSITGRYEIDKGSYNFTFQSFIRKPFLFREGGDNYILWRGNPYDADINIEAVYEAENIRFSDLAYNTSTTANGLFNRSGTAVQQYRGPILVIADLTDKLTHPKIDFHIELPPNSPLKNDQDAAFLLNIITSDPNELNKQVSFLLVFNSFGPLSTSSTAFDPQSAVTGVFMNSISGFISNQLSQVFSTKFQKIFNSKNLRFNINPSLYNGSNLITGNLDQSKWLYDRTNVNLSIAQSFLQERLTLTFGSALDFGLTAQQAQASSFQFLPDITMEYKLTPDGHVVVAMFYRDSYNYLSATNRTQNSSGASIAYRRNFDKIDELFKKRKKAKPKPIIIPQEGTAQEQPKEQSN